MYLQLPEQSIVFHFLSEVDLKDILSSSNPQLYQFPNITPQIHSIMPMENPSDIDTTEVDSKKQYFSRFIKQVQAWLQWFDRFIDVFQYMIEYFKNWRLDGAEDLFREIQTIRNDPPITVSRTKTIIQQILKVLQPFKDLERLCDLLNCLQHFEVVDNILCNPDQSKSYLAELDNPNPNNTFIVSPKTLYIKNFPIKDRQSVHWLFVSTQHHCNIKVQYQNHELFSGKNVPLDKQCLRGQFRTHQGGQLVITIDGQQYTTQRTIRYRVIQNSLSTCHLFQGIFNMYCQNYFNQTVSFVHEKDLAEVVSEVFMFIDKLLDGDTSLEEMNHLKTVFHDKNINVREEVQKLFANRSITNKKSEATTTTTTTDIKNGSVEQVCEWLRTYQVYSHVNIIIDCVRKFQIIDNSDENDQSIDHLQDMIVNEDCSLKDMSKTYKELYQRFHKLSNHHLKLIKLIVECSNVISMMKKFDLYSPTGRRRFQELRDNLTTQFQLQERHNIILKSCIVSYTLCEPFIHQVENLEGFVDNLSRLSNIDERSLEHIKSSETL